MRRSIPIIAFVLVLFLLFSCTTREEKSEKQKKNKEYTDRMIDILSKPNQEIVALLAIKYKKRFSPN
jgi:hypothetical protein